MLPPETEYQQKMRKLLKKQKKQDKRRAKKKSKKFVHFSDSAVLDSFY
jgi:hypothetical protein